MRAIPPHFEPMRSETFPYPERYAHGVSPIGPICYFDTGPQGDGPPIVLVHALGTNLTQWEHVAPQLARRTRVIGLDLPGCGHSARPRHRYTLAEMAQAVHGLLDFLHIDRAVLLGHSFGGRVVTEVALRHRARVSGLVLMNSSGFNTYPRALHAAARVFFRPRVMAPLLTHGVNFVLRNIFATRNSHTEKFIRSVVERPESRYAWDFAYYAAPLRRDIMSDVLDRLDQLTLPILVIWGDRDALLRFQDVSSWIGRLKDARLVTIHNCGHMPNLEFPDRVSAVTLEFLGRFSIDTDQRRTKLQVG